MKTYYVIFINSKTGLSQGTTVKAASKKAAEEKVEQTRNVSKIIESCEQ